MYSIKSDRNQTCRTSISSGVLHKRENFDFQVGNMSIRHLRLSLSPSDSITLPLHNHHSVDLIHPTSDLNSVPLTFFQIEHLNSGLLTELPSPPTSLESILPAPYGTVAFIKETDVEFDTLHVESLLDVHAVEEVRRMLRAAETQVDFSYWDVAELGVDLFADQMRACQEFGDSVKEELWASFGRVFMTRTRVDFAEVDGVLYDDATDLNGEVEEFHDAEDSVLQIEGKRDYDDERIDNTDRGLHFK